jgi:hypothetical protein
VRADVVTQLRESIGALPEAGSGRAG